MRWHIPTVEEGVLRSLQLTYPVFLDIVIKKYYNMTLCAFEFERAVTTVGRATAEMGEFNFPCVGGLG